MWFLFEQFSLEENGVNSIKGKSRLNPEDRKKNFKGKKSKNIQERKDSLSGDKR